MKPEVPKVVVKEEKIDDDIIMESSTSQCPTNNLSKNNFKPHNYGNTDFTKFHNQSKDVLYIAKRLQKVNILQLKYISMPLCIFFFINIIYLS